MADRIVYLIADSAMAYLVARDRAIAGEDRDLPVSNLRSALPRGTGVQLTVAEEDLRHDADGRLVVSSAAVTPERIGRALQPWHVDVEPAQAARWKGYLDPVYNMTLVNLVGATTPDELDRKETPYVEARLIELAERPVSRTFDLKHLREIHRRLFQDVYPWAGETRTIDMHRPGGPSFVKWQDIPGELDIIATEVRDRGHLRGLEPTAFAAQAALIYNGLNTTHAFREGNGRTQRAWLSDLAELAGYSFDWSAVEGYRNDRASLLAREGDLDPLRQMFAAIVRPRPTTTPTGGEVDEPTAAARFGSTGASAARVRRPTTDSATVTPRADLPYERGRTRGR